MKIKLVDDDDAMLGAWSDAKITGAEVVRGDPLRENSAALVCPGDSLGLMDMGFANIVATRWSNVRGSVRHGIAMGHYGDMPIGCAIMTATGTMDIPWLIYVSARYRMGTSGVDPYLAYRATRGALSLIRLSGANGPTGTPVRDFIDSIIIPPMARYSEERGGLKRCAAQMKFAIHHMDDRLVANDYSDVTSLMDDMRNF